MPKNLRVKLGKLILKNPVILASGTFDKGICSKIEIDKLGAIITKTITTKPRKGNPLPHIFKSKFGYFNSVGLKNPGLKKYLKIDLPYWKSFNTEVIPSIGGENEKEYIELAKIFNNQSVNAIEVNISCPNIDNGGMAFGQDPKIANKIISKI